MEIMKSEMKETNVAVAMKKLIYLIKMNMLKELCGLLVIEVFADISTS